MARYRFQASLHRRPAGQVRRNAHVIDGREVIALEWPAVRRSEPFDCSFEDASAALARLPRMFIEPDGSFVWTGDDEVGGAWQLDGVLYDRAGRLLYVELRGSCPTGALDAALRSVGWPDVGVMFQLTQSGLFVDETEFRAWAVLDDRAAPL